MKKIKIVKDFINVLSYDRDIGQYIEIESINGDKFTLKYTVPFQRRLISKYDFRNIAPIFFNVEKCITLPDGFGFGSGSYELVIDISACNINSILRETKRYRDKAQRKLDEINKQDKEKRELRENLSRPALDKISKEIEISKKQAEDTEDKYEYYRIMKNLESQISEKQKIMIHYGLMSPYKGRH